MRTVGEAEKSQKQKDIENYGYCIVENFLSSGEVASYLDLVNSCFKEVQSLKYEGRPERDSRDQMIYNLANKNKRFLDLLTDPFLKSILIKYLNDPFYRFLPPDVPNYYLSYYNARSSGAPLDLHIDSYVPATGARTWAMQVVFVLEDHTLENGCTVVVPGSHMSGRYTDRELENIKPLLPKAGSVVIWDSRLWHGTMENKSQDTRWALIATCSMWWVKPSMDLTRSLSEEIYSQITDEQKALLGFCSIPPADEFKGINTKSGYESLLAKRSDYYK